MSALCHGLVVDSTFERSENFAVSLISYILLASSEGCGLYLRMRAIQTGTRLYYSMLLVVFSHDCDIKHTCRGDIIFYEVEGGHVLLSGGDFFV